MEARKCEVERCGGGERSRRGEVGEGKGNKRWERMERKRVVDGVREGV